jgi:Effector-associated domain 10
MTIQDEIEPLIDRIINGQHTNADIETLRQLLVSGDRQLILQLGKYNVNIGEGKDIHIGDRIDQSNNIEAIKKVLLEFFTDSTVKTPLEEYDSAASVSICDSYARCREIDDECKKNLEKDRIRIGISPNESLIKTYRIF